MEENEEYGGVRWENPEQGESEVNANQSFHAISPSHDKYPCEVNLRALEQVQKLLLAQTEAIASLQQQLATRPAHHPAAPRSSAPEKCDVEMSTVAFRSWRRSMRCWLDLNRRETAAVAAVTPLPGAPVAATHRQPSKPRCGNCGTMHKPGRGSCPAGELACFNCGKTGHLRSLCKSRTKKAAAAEDLEANGITRAQVCVAGPGLLATLGIETASLARRGKLRDLANVSLKSMGAFSCIMRHGNRTTTQDVFVVKTASRCYISLQACKDLGLAQSPPLPKPGPAPPLSRTLSRLAQRVRQPAWMADFVPGMFPQ
ncbi:hypothetical protein O3P69_011142 [Scylla paramamosain]|uniref:CCHC-type domain-containing protein n=1 Tax=Scylla paramamosain TaxID=85552 RepID=A0AAW0STJ9_SCYPA